MNRRHSRRRYLAPIAWLLGCALVLAGMAMLATADIVGLGNPHRAPYLISGLALGAGGIASALLGNLLYYRQRRPDRISD